MTLVELTGNAARNNALQWFHRTSGRPRERLRMLEDALALPAPAAEPTSAGAFVEPIEETIQEQSKREIMSVLVPLTQSEIMALVRRAAHAKRRLLAALLHLPPRPSRHNTTVAEHTHT